MKKILIADDEEDLRNLLKIGLESKGYQVVACADGAEALAKASTENPDLLILDLTMPVCSGIEVVHRMTQDNILPGVGIIILTCKEKISGKDDELSDRVSSYFTKPFSFEEILAEIERLIGQA